MDREQFRAAVSTARLERIQISVGSNGDAATLDVLIRPMSVEARDRFESAGVGTNSNLRARILIACVCDTDGEPMFSDADLRFVNGLPAVTMEPLFDACLKANGFGEQAIKDAEEN